MVRYRQVLPVSSIGTRSNGYWKRFIGSRTSRIGTLWMPRNLVAAQISPRGSNQVPNPSAKHDCVDHNKVPPRKDGRNKRSVRPEPCCGSLRSFPAELYYHGYWSARTYSAYCADAIPVEPSHGSQRINVNGDPIRVGGKRRFTTPRLAPGEHNGTHGPSTYARNPGRRHSGCQLSRLEIVDVKLWQRHDSSKPNDQAQEQQDRLVQPHPNLALACDRVYYCRVFRAHVALVSQ
jgi:hypothetical protein